MKNKYLILITATAMFASTAQAMELKGGYGACVSEDLFDQFISALVKKDVRGQRYLMKNGCIITKSGVPVSLLDSTWTGKAKVRAYAGGRAVILWTNSENIKR